MGGGGIWFGPRVLVQVAMGRGLRIGREGRFDQSEAYDRSCFVGKYGFLGAIGKNWRWYISFTLCSD